MNEILSQDSKNHAVDRAKSVGPTNSKRSRCWITLFQFCKVPRALSRKLMTLWLSNSAARGFRCGSCRRLKMAKMSKNLPKQTSSKWPTPTSVRLVRVSGWVLRHPGMLEGRLLPSYAHRRHHSSGTFSIYQWSLFLFQLQFPRTVRYLAVGIDGLLLHSAPSSLWWTRENVYMIKLQHIASSDQGKSGGNLWTDRQQ